MTASHRFQICLQGLSDDPDQDVESLEDTENLEDILKLSNEIEKDPVPGEFILTKFVIYRTCKTQLQCTFTCNPITSMFY